MRVFSYAILLKNRPDDAKHSLKFSVKTENRFWKYPDSRTSLLSRTIYYRSTDFFSQLVSCK